MAGTLAADVFAAAGLASLVFLAAVEVLPTLDVAGLEVAAAAERLAGALDPTLGAAELLLLAGCVVLGAVLEMGALVGAGFGAGFFSAVPTSVLLAGVIADPTDVLVRGAVADADAGFAFVAGAVLFSTGFEVAEVGLVVPVAGLEDAGSGFLAGISIEADGLGLAGSGLRVRPVSFFAVVFAELLCFGVEDVVAGLPATGCFFIGDFAAGIVLADASVFVASDFVAGLSVEDVLGLGAGDALAVGFVFCAAGEGFAVAATFGVLALCSGNVPCVCVAATSAFVSGNESCFTSDSASAFGSVAPSPAGLATCSEMAASFCSPRMVSSTVQELWLKVALASFSSPDGEIDGSAGFTNRHPLSFSESESSVTPSASGMFSGIAPMSTTGAGVSSTAAFACSLMHCTA